MKKHSLISFIVLLTFSFPLHPMEDTKKLDNTTHKQKEISRQYADQTIELLKSFWKNNLTLLSLVPSAKNATAKELFQLIENIKSIKKDPSNTFVVLQDFKVASSKVPNILIGIQDGDNKFVKINKSILGNLIAFYDGIQLKALNEAT